MKHLIFDSTPTGIYFESHTNNELICQWVSKNLESFSLNDPHSCSVLLVKDNTLEISGDEDCVFIQIHTVLPIKL